MSAAQDGNGRSRWAPTEREVPAALKPLRSVIGLASPFVSALLSAIIVLIGWSYLAGGKITALELGRDQNRAAIVEIKAVLADHMHDQQRMMELLTSIDKRLGELQAEQRILHGRAR